MQATFGIVASSDVEDARSTLDRIRGYDPLSAQVSFEKESPEEVAEPEKAPSSPCTDYICDNKGNTTHHLFPEVVIVLGILENTKSSLKKKLDVLYSELDSIIETINHLKLSLGQKMNTVVPEYGKEMIPSPPVVPFVPPSNSEASNGFQRESSMSLAPFFGSDNKRNSQLFDNSAFENTHFTGTDMFFSNPLVDAGFRMSCQTPLVNVGIPDLDVESGRRPSYGTPFFNSFYDTGLSSSNKCMNSMRLPYSENAFHHLQGKTVHFPATHPFLTHLPLRTADDKTAGLHLLYRILIVFIAGFWSHCSRF